MTVEAALYPPQLNTLWPTSADMVSEGDNHIRLEKIVLKTTFPNMGGAWLATHTEANYLVGVTSGIQGQLDGKASTAGPTFTGTVTLPATTSIGPVTSTELGYLDGVTSAIQTQLNAKGAIAGQAWTGAQNFTGATVSVPTLTAGTTGNGAASVDFVAATAFVSALPGQTGNARKFVTTDGANASWAFPFLKGAVVSGPSQTAIAGFSYVLTNAAPTTVTLPASPADGDVVGIEPANLLLTNVVARNGQLLMGLAEDMTLNNPYVPVLLRFRTGYGWRLA